MRGSGKNGQEKTGTGSAYGTSSLEDIVRTIVELSGMCAESARAGGGAWYEMTVYVHPNGLRFQVQRHGSVVGGDFPPLPRKEFRFAASRIASWEVEKWEKQQLLSV